MSEYVQKFQQLDQTGQQEVLDFMDFLIARRKPQLSSGTNADPKFITQSDFPSNEDAKAVEEVNSGRSFSTIPGLIIHMADDFDAPLDAFSEYR